jgi:hypothetical protein
MSINSINGNTLLTSGSFPPVRVASTGTPLTPTTGGLLVVDGVQLVAGDRVLCKDEASAINNGIYAVSTGPWVRTSDAADNQNFFSGMAVTVALGALNAGLTYICTTTDDPVVIGTSNITFAAQSVVATATQQATSTTSLAIDTGSKTFTTQAGKAFQISQWVLVNETSNSANQMLGQITGYSGTSLTVNVTATGGSGTHADWTIVLTNSPAAAGLQPPVGSGNVTGPGSSTAGHVATFADATGKVIQDGGTLVGGANTITPSMLANAAVAFGVGMLNGTIVPSVAGNALTLAVKTLAGADPSVNDPVSFVFRSATPGSGSYSVIDVTAALSTTVPASSTLGFANATPGRVWLAAVSSAGTVSLAVVNCLTLSGGAPAAIFPLAGFAIANVTAYGGGANSAGVLFGAGSLSNVPYSVLGFVAWETGNTLATAGTWNLTPSCTELYRPGVALPGSVVQTVINSTTTVGSVANTNFTALTSGQTASITPSSSVNVVRVRAQGTLQNASGNNSGFMQLARGVTLVGNAVELGGTAIGAAMFAPSDIVVYDLPASLSAVTYGFQAKNSGGSTMSYPTGSTGAVLELEEIAA